MFGFLKKPRWSLQFWNPGARQHFALESDSIGELLGYLATDLEKGRRPSAIWVVQLVHRKLKRVQISHEWPDNQNPVSQILAGCLEIDANMTRARRSPNFLELKGAKRVALPLNSSIGGRSLVAMPLEERIELHQSGQISSATVGIFDVIKQSFTEEFGIQSPLAGQVIYKKIDP